MTPLGILGINGRQLVVESDGENLVVFVIDGNAVLEELGGDTAPVQVNAGQKAVISRTGPGATGAVQVGPMEGAEMQNVARSVSQACRPKRQVFFASSEEDGVDVVPVLPPAPAHVQPVSPDRL